MLRSDLTALKKEISAAFSAVDVAAATCCGHRAACASSLVLSHARCHFCAELTVSVARRPFTDGSKKTLSATVRAVEARRPKRKRSTISDHKYQLAFDEDGGTRGEELTRYWTRLLHLEHTVQPMAPPAGHYTSLADKLNPNRKGFDKAFKANYEQLSAKARKKLIKKDSDKLAELRERGTAIVHQFEANEADHCETSAESYRDIAPLLELLSQKLGKQVAIYDPYYCAGSMKQHLSALGFSDVYNENEDFYQTIEQAKVPPHDVLITNPPFGEEHMRRLLQFTQSNAKPFFLLLPEYVRRKPYFLTAVNEGKIKPVYLCPKARYHFWSPIGLRDGWVKGHKAGTHKNLGLGVRNSPFVAFWYLCVEPVMSTKELLECCANAAETGSPAGLADTLERCVVCESTEGLPKNVGFNK